MVDAASSDWSPILQRWTNFDRLLGSELWVVRDDLLPFPLAGNKVRKLGAELKDLSPDVEVLISNGSVDSNHCRTIAMFAAQQGRQAHLVLHGDPNLEQSGLRMLQALGATFDVGPASTIQSRITASKERFTNQGKSVHIVSGGGHTPAGARAFRDAGMEVFKQVKFNQVFVASGTGATHGGLSAAASLVSPTTDIIGISVARNEERGIPPVAEAAQWAGENSPVVNFLDDYRAGGYGLADEKIQEAVTLGWSLGLPLDLTYTGKAFSAIIDWSARGELKDTVLFWHTGGLWNWINP